MKCPLCKGYLKKGLGKDDFCILQGHRRSSFTLIYQLNTSGNQCYKKLPVVSPSKMYDN